MRDLFFLPVTSKALVSMRAARKVLLLRTGRLVEGLQVNGHLRGIVVALEILEVALKAASAGSWVYYNNVATRCGRKGKKGKEERWDAHQAARALRRRRSFWAASGGKMNVCVSKQR